ncbi:L-dopachrome tautomerase-related protein [Pseudomonas oryzihabitans]|uniref:L-dopachrome tautomerase-related protein n=1 Tax=Pseudomonas oryzihabitans TaxID=47885 RepID=UPI0011A7DA16|nr:L-dopachrome tautomerase-related protein [Pseudomonas oryzihabitans]QEU05653.1 gluconolaconase [Pseudomonas oryzihabitans]
MPRLSALTLAVALAVGSLTAQAAPLPQERTLGQLEPVFAFQDAMPTGVTVSETGRIFVNYPRWGDAVPFTVAELKDGKAVPYPDAALNVETPGQPGKGFISVQSVVADGRGHLWVLDTAAPGFAAPKAGGAKLVAIDLKTNKVARTLVFPAAVLEPNSYVNDVRFDFRVGRAGVAYVTDSAPPGGLIILDLATGQAQRRLTGAPQANVDPSFVPVVEGEPLLMQRPDGSKVPPAIASDGIALSPDGGTLYFSPLSSRHLYAVPTALLRDPEASEAQVRAGVQDLGEKGASDGLEADAQGRVYAGDYEHNAVRQRQADGSWKTLVHDPRVLWPDTFSIGPDGYLYFTANQLHRQAQFHGGQDLRQKPYSLFRVKIDAQPAPTH